MQVYADASGYRPVESFDAYAITGDAEGWLASIGIPAVTVELSTHETVEWEKNLKGVTALFDLYQNGPKDHQVTDIETLPDDTEDDLVACTLEAKMCPDGSFVGREGPNCEFAPCPSSEIGENDVSMHIESKADLIRLRTPMPNTVIRTPLDISGVARGVWYFEANFPIVLVDWDGKIIAEYYATADGEWMTQEFVPFFSRFEFESPYNDGDPDFMKKGTLILKKANASDLPQYDDALEIPIRFAS